MPIKFSNKKSSDDVYVLPLSGEFYASSGSEVTYTIDTEPTTSLPLLIEISGQWLTLTEIDDLIDFLQSAKKKILKTKVKNAAKYVDPN